MSDKEYGYARVSSREQNLDRQLDALEAFGLEEGRIFADRASGKDFKRPQWRRLARRLRRGDVLVVKSIDRLGRNCEEVIEEWRRLTRERGVRFGRPAIERPSCYGDTRRSYLAGEVTRREAASRLGVSASTFDKWIREDAGRDAHA